MHKILVVGAGRIGSAVAKMLMLSPDYEVTSVDSDTKAIASVTGYSPRLTGVLADISVPGTLERLMEGKDAVVSAAIFSANSAIAVAALKCGLSYFDLTEDVNTTRFIANHTSINAAEGQIFMPQCGLAPGFICIAANTLAQDFENLDEVKMRVGALPRFPSNELKYNLSWSPDGLINEYCNGCEALVDGVKVELPPMEGLETLSIDGEEYEAFNTSGGLGTLCDSLRPKVSKLSYKTIRYPGHQKLMCFLLNGLRMAEHPDILVKIFKEAVPTSDQDVVITFVSAIGWKNGKLFEKVDARKIYGKLVGSTHMTAIQTTTAAGICAAVDMHFSGQLPKKGFVTQENIHLDNFLVNRFGRFYLDDPARRSW